MENLFLTSVITTKIKPFDEAFMLHVHSSCPPTGVQQEPLSFQQHSVPQVIRFHILEALALTIPNAFAVAWHFLALDANLSVNTVTNISFCFVSKVLKHWFRVG